MKNLKPKNASIQANTDFGAELGATGFIRVGQLRTIVPVSRSTLWRWIKDKQFPAPIKIGGGRVTAWKVEDVRAWLDQQHGPGAES